MSYRAFAELLFWLLVGHFCREDSFTTRTLQLRQSDEGDRCGFVSIERRIDGRWDFRIWGCGREVLAWRFSESNLIGAMASSALLHSNGHRKRMK
jgi:hypothetical protein